MKILKWNKVTEVGQPTEEGNYLIFAPSNDHLKPLVLCVFWFSDSGFQLVDAWKKGVSHWIKADNLWPEDYDASPRPR